MKKQLTVNEVAEILRCHRVTITKLIHEGRLKAFKIGSGRRIRYLISPEEVQKLCENG